MCDIVYHDSTYFTFLKVMTVYLCLGTHLALWMVPAEIIPSEKLNSVRSMQFKQGTFTWDNLLIKKASNSTVVIAAKGTLLNLFVFLTNITALFKVTDMVRSRAK